MKTKQKELTLPMSELNGTFAFIPVKIGTKPKQREFFVQNSERNGTFCLFQLHPREQIHLLLKKRMLTLLGGANIHKASQIRGDGQNYLQISAPIPLREFY
jgi:hypothetical protein